MSLFFKYLTSVVSVLLLAGAVAWLRARTRRET